MKAIILAAGKGTRMMPLTKNTPKCLLPLENGSTVLETQLEALEKSGAVEEVVVVLGYLAEQVEAKIKGIKTGMKIKTVYNPFYDSANNLISLWCAQHEMNSDFVIINGDDVFHESVISKISEYKDDGVYVTVDLLKTYSEDDMKVKIQNNRIVRISKKIPLDEAQGESVGIIRVKGESQGKACKEMLLNIVKKEEGRNIFWLEVFNGIADNGVTLTPFEISESDWAEVDFHADLKIMKKKILKFGWTEE